MTIFPHRNCPCFHDAARSGGGCRINRVGADRPAAALLQLQLRLSGKLQLTVASLCGASDAGAASHITRSDSAGRCKLLFSTHHFTVANPIRPIRDETDVEETFSEERK
ncbi:hypothetical protein GUJ93_ZPchr0006g40647 [Zizania palustris]|uniref:Uncharacterized protein n=1 Tax=Zizania palustris TaxID=103762 RepID=A0A8J5SHT5_ZIZPA|nr:hypothetical protein GUJ93_ZPchr0006g40647 [Zizania palustris]